MWTRILQTLSACWPSLALAWLLDSQTWMSFYLFYITSSRPRADPPSYLAQSPSFLFVTQQKLFHREPAGLAVFATFFPSSFYQAHLKGAWKRPSIFFCYCREFSDRYLPVEKASSGAVEWERKAWVLSLLFELRLSTFQPSLEALYNTGFIYFIFICFHILFDAPVPYCFFQNFSI